MILVGPGRIVLEGVIESTIGGLLSKWTEDDLRTAIEKDVILIDMVLQYYPNIIIAGRRMAKHFPGEKLTESIVMKWVEKRHGKFSKPLQTPTGRAWLKKNLEAIRQVLWR